MRYTSFLYNITSDLNWYIISRFRLNWDKLICGVDLLVFDILLVRCVFQKQWSRWRHRTDPRPLGSSRPTVPRSVSRFSALWYLGGDVEAGRCRSALATWIPVVLVDNHSTCIIHISVYQPGYLKPTIQVSTTTGVRRELTGEFQWWLMYTRDFGCSLLAVVGAISVFKNRITRNETRHSAEPRALLDRWMLYLTFAKHAQTKTHEMRTFVMFIAIMCIPKSHARRAHFCSSRRNGRSAECVVVGGMVPEVW